MAEEAAAQLRGADQQAWLDRLETEHDNVRAALSYARTPGAEANGLRLVAALWFFWLLHGHVAEGRSHLSAALSRVRGQDESIIAKALCGAAILAFEQGDYEAARPLCEDALTMQEGSGDRAGMASSWNVLASLASIKGDYESARSLYERSLAIRRELGDHSGVAGSLSNLGHLAADQADYATARALYEESLAIRRQLGDKKGIATSLTTIGFVMYRLADCRSARMHLEESLAICRQLGDRAGMADALCYLGYVAMEEGAPLSARALHGECCGLQLLATSGTRTCTASPPPAAFANTRVPPRDSMRSRIPRIPRRPGLTRSDSAVPVPSSSTVSDRLSACAASAIVQRVA